MPGPTAVSGSGPHTQQLLPRTCSCVFYYLGSALAQVAGLVLFLWSLPPQACSVLGCWLIPAFSNVPVLDLLLLPWSSPSQV